MIIGNRLLLLSLVALSTHVAAETALEQRPGNAVERHLSTDDAYSNWVHDPKALQEKGGDRIETREVVRADAQTVKLKGVVPAVRFDSGRAQIPASTVHELRVILEGLRSRANVRLHLLGHADNQPLSGALAARYGDNAGLSRERAGEVAEFFQEALSLDPASITYEWSGDTQPVASNDTAEGRALNRRVEVEVWYDEIEDRLDREEVIVASDVKRVKVCRVETVCKLRYIDGHNRRARVQNLIAPLNYNEDSLEVTTAFTERVKRTLANLSDKQNVMVKFIGHTDSTALDQRSERIYGSHEGLSKARAWRVALAVRERLGLESDAIDADGFGAQRPLASNETPRGKAMNRRVEVEFWYDDPLQELPDEPQLCPEDPAAELVSRVYDPPWGTIPALDLQDGQPQIPAGYADKLSRALSEVADRQNARLRFIGYTRNETLDRRTAGVYGDDVGLSAARARHSMELLSKQLGLAANQAEFEGRGYVHSNDVVNAGFIQGDTSYVVVQVVYDELAVLDDKEGLEVQPIKRELEPQNAFALNLMRITVDGDPIDDPGRSSADIQRCTDVALDSANIHFGYDNLTSSPRLSVEAEPARIPVPADTGVPSTPVLFRMYANYDYFIDRSEVRIFEAGASTRKTPVAVIAVADDGMALWQADAGEFDWSLRQLQYVLRAYGRDGNFDETEPRPLWLVATPAAPGPVTDIAGIDALQEQTDTTPAVDINAGEGREPEVAAASDEIATGAYRDDPELLAAYGDNALALQNIRLSSGTVRVQGSRIPPGHNVWVAGHLVPVDAEGNFVAEQILPEGTHTVEVAVLDQDGNGELFLRDLAFEPNDWFYVGMADLTLTYHQTSGPIDLLQGENAPSDYDALAEGRLAFYANGKFGDKWRLTTSVDTREEPLDQMFSNFVNKSPDALFRRIDPDYHYPTFGDDSTVAETAPTSGKFYLKVNRGDNHALWGNFKVGYNDNELAQVDRGLFGANMHYESEQTTSFGERRFAVDGFGAEPGTIPTRQEFRGTGGSLYFLRHQDLLIGSERVRIELRDSASGLVTGVVELQPALDYDIDYFQGTVLLSEPLTSTVDDEMLVRSGAVDGDEAYLVVRYEYTPGFDEIDTMATGAQGHYWISDFVKVGLTGNINEQDGSDSSLQAADITVRKTADSWFKLQAASTEGLVTDTLRSNDGGYGFYGLDDVSLLDSRANAYRMDISVGLGDFLDGARGRLTLYAQNLDAGYAAPGLSTLTDTENAGGSLSLPVGQRWTISGKSDIRSQDLGISTDRHELNVGYQLSERWDISTGLRQDVREDNSPLVPLTQDVGDRTDGIVQVGFDPGARWRAYGFLQETLARSESREDNGRIGLGGTYPLTEKLNLEGEISTGDLGAGGRLGSTYNYSNQTSLYLNYALENERTDNVQRTRRGREGSLVSGIKSRLSDSASVYVEERYRHGQSMTGLTHSTGVNLMPAQRWNMGISSDFGTLQDVLTGAETERKAIGVRASYSLDAIFFSSGVEYRKDVSEQADLTSTSRETWLFRNSFKYQSTPSARWLGKLNHSTSESSLGQFYDGGYTEASLGYAYRPVYHDRLNALLKYTYFYNVPSTDQVTLVNSPAEFIQKSHIGAVDLTYDITNRWTLGGKYAYRLGQISLDRDNLQFFDNRAHLYVLRTDYRMFDNWEVLLETRMLNMPDFGEQRSGVLMTVSRYLGQHLKLGVGYNFTDFSDDLTDLNFDHHGLFLNITGML